ncbi:NADH dehydrogenase (ubiquinone) flavoprotein 2 [Angomonas deanei]|uniref:Thioredoxin-like [2Fe-2S] ferredoxin, putative n=1 Tax=Angomonas deanei TaxID=59799 RepID=A0A7G2CPP3_9TRYP|nr:NADH dehydrogenase (ubiquinone) flavoprotein 2 [Angomonas deanei]CAD2221750.1 Thioredoxin-like [2Fe-2S] ferredoxin, putative [Angomonas deanei]|eukprot:EPY34415.1 NADH dehydrogenase (ubiquinone) flavoprotein 2 [Angomonas deanei]
MWKLPFRTPLVRGVAATSSLVTPSRAIHGEMRHTNTDTDNTRIPWDFTTASYEKIHNEILPKFPRGKRISATIPLLHLAQQQQGGYIPVTAMYKIAKICEVPPMHVFETVTFYSMFNRHPVGKYHIQFCRTTPCMLCGSDDLMEKTKAYLNIDMHGTTADGLITMGESECLGACVNAPMLVVSDYSNPPHYSYDYLEDLTWESLKQLIEDLRSGKPYKKGPQRPDRKVSMPAGGRTSIFFKEPPAPYCRDIDAKPEEKK